jgi:hypothetical protein
VELAVRGPVRPLRSISTGTPAAAASGGHTKIKKDLASAKLKGRPSPELQTKRSRRRAEATGQPADGGGTQR